MSLVPVQFLPQSNTNYKTTGVCCLGACSILLLFKYHLLCRDVQLCNLKNEWEHYFPIHPYIVLGVWIWDRTGSE